MRSAVGFVVALCVLVVGGCTEKTASTTAPESGPTASAATELTRIPGTAFALDPPSGFTLAEEFSGFGDASTGSSLMVQVMPGPFSEITRGFSDPTNLEAQGMVALTQQPLRHGELDGLMVRVDQQIQGVTAQKWIWLFGDAEATAFVMGTCVQSDCEAQLELLQQSMMTVSWDRSIVPAADEALGYELEDMAGLEVGGRMQKMLTLTPNGKAQVDKANPIVFIVGPALGSGQIVDREGFARQRFAQFPIDDLAVKTVDAVKIDGLEGYALEGTGTSLGGVEVFVFSTILFEDDNYWVAFGYAPLGTRGEWLPRFRRVAEGLRRDTE